MDLVYYFLRYFIVLLNVHIDCEIFFSFLCADVGSNLTVGTRIKHEERLSNEKTTKALDIDANEIKPSKVAIRSVEDEEKLKSLFIIIIIFQNFCYI